jgi:GTPase SAR1 family protein
MSVQRFKVVLLGEGRVGKTSILLRYIKGEYNDRQISTLQASYLDKKVIVGTATTHLSVWDTAGNRYDSFRFSLGEATRLPDGRFASVLVLFAYCTEKPKDTKSFS